ncbi:MAG: GAF domain-containing protein [Chloroflexi bacterium]|nr:GAF domain-containing protein [Chloroflexota bacterium]
MSTTGSLWTRLTRPSLRARLILGYGSVLILFLLLGAMTTYQLNRINEANTILQQETRNALAAQELSRDSLELIVAIDKGILLEDVAEFTGPVTEALQRFEDQHKVVREAITDTLRLDTTVASLTSVVRPMVLQAEGGSWSVLRDNRVSRVDDKIARLSQAIDEVVLSTETRQTRALTQALGAQQTVYIYLAGSFLFAVLLGTYIVYSTVRSVTRSVGVLAAGASRLAAGELDQRIQVQSQDEIGRLSLVFNDMAAQLQSLYQSLERRVAERTTELQRRSIQLEAAAQVARESAAIRDVSQLLNATVGLISQQFGFYHAGIFLVDQTGDYAILEAASSEGGQQMLARGHRLGVGTEGIVGYVSQTGSPRIVRDVQADDTYFKNPDLPLTRSEMAIPLQVRDRVIGVLDVQSTEPAAFIEEDVAVLQTMADQVALAIENARLLKETEERLQEMNVLLGRYSRESWEQLAVERPNWGYVYDGVKVTPRDASDTAQMDSQLSVPLQIRGETIGHLDLSFADHALTDEDTAITQAVVDQATQALETARLFREARQRLAGLEILQRASLQLGSAQDLPAVLNSVAESVLAVFPAINCHLYLYDQDRDEFAPGIALWRDGGREPVVKIPRRDGLTATVARTGEPFIIDNAPRHPLYAGPEAQDWDLQAIAGFPIRRAGRTLAVFTMTFPGPHVFSDAEQRILDLLIDQAAVTIDQVQLFQATQHRAEQERLRAEITSRIRASTEIDTILQTAIQELGRSLRAADGLISLESSGKQGKGEEMRP